MVPTGQSEQQLERNYGLTCIPNNTEKYISSLGQLRFIDSAQFLLASLDRQAGEQHGLDSSCECRAGLKGEIIRHWKFEGVCKC